MGRVIVRYRVKPDQVEPNEELVRAVYEELHRAGPPGLRYATFKLEDGVTFVHLAEWEKGESPLPKVPAFQEFNRGIADRCDEPPQVLKATEIGSFRFRETEG
jgi:hypothetical protein